MPTSSSEVLSGSVGKSSEVRSALGRRKGLRAISTRSTADIVPSDEPLHQVYIRRRVGFSGLTSKYRSGSGLGLTTRSMTWGGRGLVEGEIYRMHGEVSSDLRICMA